MWNSIVTRWFPDNCLDVGVFSELRYDAGSSSGNALFIVFQSSLQVAQLCNLVGHVRLIVEDVVLRSLAHEVEGLIEREFQARLST